MTLNDLSGKLDGDGELLEEPSGDSPRGFFWRRFSLRARFLIAGFIFFTVLFSGIGIGVIQTVSLIDQRHVEWTGIHILRRVPYGVPSSLSTGDVFAEGQVSDVFLGEQGPISVISFTWNDGHPWSYPRELFYEPSYTPHVIIFDDMSPEGVVPDDLAQLAVYEEEGRVGLLFFGGENLKKWQDSPISHLIPVNLEGAEYHTSIEAGILIRDEGFPPFKDLDFSTFPSIQALTKVTPKKGAEVAAEAVIDGSPNPLLVWWEVKGARILVWTGSFGNIFKWQTEEFYRSDGRSGGPVLARELAYFTANRRSGRSQGDQYRYDIEEQTSLSIQGLGISDITGLGQYTNLRELWINDNQISNISPISVLEKLHTLHLAHNSISDILPISGLTEIHDLDLEYNEIKDISALSALTNLRRLDLEMNRIEDISPLAAVTGLQWLDLFGNRINDLSPLLENKGLGKGDQIILTGNPLSHESVNTVIPLLRDRGITVDFQGGGISAMVRDAEGRPWRHFQNFTLGENCTAMLDLENREVVEWTFSLTVKLDGQTVTTMPEIKVEPLSTHKETISFNLNVSGDQVGLEFVICYKRSGDQKPCDQDFQHYWITVNE